MNNYALSLYYRGWTRHVASLRAVHLAFLFTLFVGLFTLAGCSDPKPVPPINVKTATAASRELQTTIKLSGVLLPAQTADVSSRISGQIKSVMVDVGSPVKAGDVLVVLDMDLLNAQLMQAEAGLKAAEAAARVVQSQADLAKINLETAQKNYNRTKALSDAGTTSQSQLDDATAKLDTAKKQKNNAAGPAVEQAHASIETAKANLENLKVQINSATIRSPFDGIVTNRNADPGEVVSPGGVLVSVADTTTLKMKSSITQDLVPFLTLGQEIAVIIDIYPDRQSTGMISGIGPIAVNTGGVFPLEITIQNDGNILSGLSARAMLNISAHNGVIVPIAALLESGEKSVVFVVQGQTVQKREVTTGLRNEQDVQILSGLTAGDLVAVTNLRALSDNLTVNVQ